MTVSDLLNIQTSDDWCVTTDFSIFADLNDASDLAGRLISPG